MLRAHHRGREVRIVGIGCAVLALLLLAWNLMTVRPLGPGDYALWIVASLPLALSAMTQTLPILAGGQGLAAGATAYLVSTVVAAAPIEGPASAAAWTAVGLLIGLAVGGLNGIIIGYLRVPSTAVTMSTAVAVGGIAQYRAANAAAAPPAEALHAMLFGPAVGGLPVVLIALVVLIAILGEALRRSRSGHGLRLLGMRPRLAERMGVPAARLRALAYAAAGLGSAATGIVLAAQLGSGDLFLGAPLLLQIYAAAALGGSVPGLRGGSIVGSLVGALIVTATSNLLLPLGIDDYLSGAFDAAWLAIGILLCRFAAGHAHSDFAQPFAPPRIVSAGTSLLSRLREAGVLQLAVGIAAAAALLVSTGHTDLPVETLAMAVLALGQGAVMRAGGLDLSMPAMIAFAGVAFVTLTQGSNAALPGAFAAIAVAALGAGLFHAVAARRFDRVSIVATLATGGALQVLMAWLAVKLPPGFAPPVLTPLMTGEGWALSPVASAGWPLVLGTALWLDHRRRRREAGPPDLAEGGSALAGAYVLSAFCGALFGVMMAVLAGQAHVGLGDTWLTPTLAAIVVGGVPFRGGQGTLLGVIGGVLMVQAFDMVLVGQGLDSQERLVALGLIMLAASVYHARGVRLGPRA